MLPTITLPKWEPILIAVPFSGNMNMLALDYFEESRKLRGYFIEMDLLLSHME